MGVLYSIPVKAIESDGAIKCSVPKEIASKMELEKGDKIIWTLYDDGKVEVQKEVKE